MLNSEWLLPPSGSRKMDGHLWIRECIVCPAGIVLNVVSDSRKTAVWPRTSGYVTCWAVRSTSVLSRTGVKQGDGELPEEKMLHHTSGGIGSISSH